MMATDLEAQSQYPQRCAQELVEEQASKQPKAVALIHAGGCLTYAELNNRANKVALALKEQGVGPEVFVGVYVSSSEDAVVGLLAVLKAGGAFVPLDPLTVIENGDWVRVDGDLGLVQITKKN